MDGKVGSVTMIFNWSRDPMFFWRAFFAILRLQNLHISFAVQSNSVAVELSVT